jgi:cytoskeleton protein RodZ
MQSDTRSGIGARLRAGRERLGMTHLQVAEKLHVDATVPESIEAERFDLLGAPVYVKGHLKRYAELVGEDMQQILDLYGTLTKPAPPDLTQLPKAARSPSPGKLVVPSLVVLIGLVLFGVVWWIWQGVQKGTIGAAVVPRAVQSAAAGESGLSPAAADEIDGTRANAAPVIAANRPSGNAAAAGGTVKPSGGSEPHADAAVRGTTPAAEGTAEPPRSRKIDLTLRFAADSWVEVYDANGERLFYDIGSASSSRKVTGKPPLRVVLGHAPGVTLDVNGQRAQVPASVVTEDSAQFMIDSAGRISRARPPGDGG